MVLDWRI
jgi:hypothetical protein